MRTTLNLDENLISELVKATEARTKTEAIHIAAAELIRRKKLEKLKALSGKVRIENNRSKCEKVESARQKKRTRGLRDHR